MIRPFLRLMLVVLLAYAAANLAYFYALPFEEIVAAQDSSGPSQRPSFLRRAKTRWA